MDDTFDSEAGGAVPDYLKIYSTEGGFDFPWIIQDDYFETIHPRWDRDVLRQSETEPLRREALAEPGRHPRAYTEPLAHGRSG